MAQLNLKELLSWQRATQHVLAKFGYKRKSKLGERVRYGRATDISDGMTLMWNIQPFSLFVGGTEMDKIFELYFTCVKIIFNWCLLK